LNRITRAALVQGVRGERTSARGHAPRRDEGCRGWRAIAVSFSIVLVLSELEVLQDVCARLERSRIAYMLTGSMAMNYYAQPRMTRDIDIVVELERMSAKEDLILSKLAWGKQSGSEVQRRDVSNLLASGADIGYLRQWAPALSVSQLLDERLNERHTP
jgi:hypothetical protein